MTDFEIKQSISRKQVFLCSSSLESLFFCFWYILLQHRSDTLGHTFRLLLFFLCMYGHHKISFASSVMNTTTGNMYYRETHCQLHNYIQIQEPDYRHIHVWWDAVSYYPKAIFLCTFKFSLYLKIQSPEHLCSKIIFMVALRIKIHYSSILLMFIRWKWHSWVANLHNAHLYFFCCFFYKRHF